MAKIKSLTGKFGDFSGIILKAAASGNLEAVSHYLHVKPDWLNQAGPHGRTLRWEAAHKGRTSRKTLRCCWIGNRGANLDHADNRGETPLFIAAHRGSVETFRLLLATGASVVERNERGQTVVEVGLASRNLAWRDCAPRQESVE